MWRSMRNILEFYNCGTVKKEENVLGYSWQKYEEKFENGKKNWYLDKAKKLYRIYDLGYPDIYNKSL